MENYFLRKTTKAATISNQFDVSAHGNTIELTNNIDDNITLKATKIGPLTKLTNIFRGEGASAYTINATKKDGTHYCTNVETPDALANKVRSFIEDNEVHNTETCSI